MLANPAQPADFLPPVPTGTKSAAQKAVVQSQEAVPDSSTSRTHSTREKLQQLHQTYALERRCFL